MDPKVTVAQLKRDVEVEEKTSIRRMSYTSFCSDPDDPDLVVGSGPHVLADEALISQFPLSESVISLASTPLNICLILEDGRMFIVEAEYHQTVSEFKSTVQLQHKISITEDVLVLFDKEVIADNASLWDHGFIAGCTVHAGEQMLFRVLPSALNLDSSAVHCL